MDDDARVLRAIECDLVKQYGDRFQILQAESGQHALELIDSLKIQQGHVALFLVDQRMPQMTGDEFLKQTINTFPEAKRVLLTDYADTDAVMKSLNKVKIDYYLTKPWDPPEEHLYPVLDDLLDEWWVSYRPPFEGIKIIGLRWSPRSHEIKEFLARNGIPYQWLDIEDDEARRLLSFVSLRKSTVISNLSSTIINSNHNDRLFSTTNENAINNNNNNNIDRNNTIPSIVSPLRTSLQSSSLHLPIIIFPDGTYIPEPTNSQIADKIGLKTRAQMAFYDLLIIGGGPSGLAAAVYAASEGLHTLVVERQAPGGQAGASSSIENYLGFPSGLTGSSLARRAIAQAVRFGAEILDPQEVVSIRVDGQYRIAKLGDGTEIRCHALLIACGVAYRKLDGVKGIDKLNGAGIYYGASMAEALHYKGQDVYIVGGANSAGQAAIYFSKYARQVTLLVRAASLAEKMSRYLIHQINETDKIRVLLNSVVTEVYGEKRLEEIAITNIQTREQQIVPAAGLFIYIGAVPHTSWLTGIIQTDANGFILTGPDLVQDELRRQGWLLERQPFLLETDIPGIFAAGDVRHGSIKRIAAGVGEGATAIQLIHQYLVKV